MSLPTWHPPLPYHFSVPPEELPKFTKEAMFAAVGRALSVWEEADAALAKLFARLIESRSPAAERAYGTIQGPQGRSQALEAAAAVFFRIHHDPLAAEVFNLLAAYSIATAYRNNIAHGVLREAELQHITERGPIPIGPVFIITTNNYSTRKLRFKVEANRTGSDLPVVVSYFYDLPTIDNVIQRFRQIRDEGNALVEEIESAWPLGR